MTADENLATFRLKRFRKEEAMPKKYCGSYQLYDESTQQVLASCDLIGKAVFAGLDIYDTEQGLWQLRANRKIMPTRWALSDPSGTVRLQFDQKLLGKLTNPLYRVALAVLDAEGTERYRLVDPRTSIPDRIMSVHVGDWSLLEGERPVAKLTSLPREPQQPTKGFFGKLKKLFQLADPGFISAGSGHLFPAPAVLALLLLFDEITDTSGGE